VLPLSRAERTVEVADVLATFGPRTRQRLRATLARTGAGLHGRGEDLNGVLAATSRFVGTGAPLARTLNAQRTSVAALIADTGAVARTLADREQQIHVLARQGLRTARAVAAHDDALGEALREAPSTLGQVRTTASALGTYSTTALPVFRGVLPVLRDLTPAMQRLAPAAQATRQAVSQLRRFLPRAQPLLSAVERFSARGRPAIPQVRDLLRQVNPLLAYAAPYAREIGGLFGNLRSVAAAYDATGHLARLHAGFSASSLAGLPTGLIDAYQALLEAGAITKIAATHTNPYPAPGTIGAPKSFSGKYPQVSAEPAR
jgi:phospholipid/cholesterol/gamma-HCH transport system substrate-binding protein